MLEKYILILKHNDEKIIVHFSNTKYNVLYNLTRFESKIYFVHRETKNKNLYKVLVGPT